MRRVQRRAGEGGSGCDWPENQVVSRLNVGHKDFLCEQFVNCLPSLLQSHHAHVRMDFVFFIPRPLFFEGTSTPTMACNGLP
jgi:hypothetical protein